MKTTKKGFTLIELIVVIAIIGVLAAILVPTMLGYVKKSKLSGATSAASSLSKAVNTAIVELDESGDLAEFMNNANEIDIYYTGEGTPGDATATTPGLWTDESKFGKKVKTYFDDITKVDNGTLATAASGIRGAAAYIDRGTCKAVAISTDGNYIGTVPTGVVTSDNYDEWTKLKDAFDEAKTEAGFTPASP